MRHFSRKLKIEHVPDNTVSIQLHVCVQRHLKIIRVAKSKSDAAFSSEVRTDVTFEFCIRVFNKAYNFVCNMTSVYVPDGRVC
jgi:hypothetical protein